MERPLNSSLERWMIGCEHLEPKVEAAARGARSGSCIPAPVMAWALHDAVTDEGMGQVLAGMWTEPLHPQAVALDGLRVVLFPQHLPYLHGLVAVAQKSHEAEVEYIGMAMQPDSHREEGFFPARSAPDDGSEHARLQRERVLGVERLLVLDDGAPRLAEVHAPDAAVGDQPHVLAKVGEEGGGLPLERSEVGLQLVRGHRRLRCGIEGAPLVAPPFAVRDEVFAGVAASRPLDDGRASGGIDPNRVARVYAQDVHVGARARE